MLHHNKHNIQVQPLHNNSISYPNINNNHNQNLDSNHLTINVATANSNSHSHSVSGSNPPRFINNLLSNKYSNHSNTSNQWEFEDSSEEFTSTHSPGNNNNNNNIYNYSSASISSHIAMGQSIELNTTSSWLCPQCKTSNLNLFYSCTQCGHKKYNKQKHHKHHPIPFKNSISDSNCDDQYFHHQHLVQL